MPSTSADLSAGVDKVDIGWRPSFEGASIATAASLALLPAPFFCSLSSFSGLWALFSLNCQYLLQQPRSLRHCSLSAHRMVCTSSDSDGARLTALLLVVAESGLVMDSSAWTGAGLLEAVSAAAGTSVDMVIYASIQLSRSKQWID